MVMMTREEYYAQIADMYVQMYESKDKEIEAEDRRFREYLMRSNDRRFREYLMRRNDDETDWWYRSEKENPEDQSLDNEELVETVVATDPIETEHGTVSLVPEAQEEESIPQSKVPIANSEILKSIEPGKVDLGLEKLEHVVINENLAQGWVQKNVKRSLEADGDVGKGQKMISDANICCAHKVFVKMPSKEKHMKHLKAWKFKFKSTSKRSRLMDNKFPFVDATVWLNKDPQETIWDCVKKEFKETMAACGKNGGGSLLECIDEESFGDDRPREVIAELNSYTGLTHLDKSDLRRFDGDKIKEWLFKVEEFFSIDFTPMELMVKRASNHFDGDATNWHQSLVQSGQFGQLLTNADYVQQDEFEQVVNHTPFSVVKFGRYKACDALLLLLPSDERFQIKHKWRFRLSHSFSEMKQRIIGRVWKSFGYLMEDMLEEEQKLQGDSEPLLNVPDFAAKICETFDQYIRGKRSVSADREGESNQATLRFSMWVIEILLNHYMVLLLTPVAYAIQFLGGIGMDKKQSHLSLRNNRVWDPGG